MPPLAQSTYNFIQSNSNAIWGPIIGAAIALVGTWASNIYTSRNQKHQWERESKEKEKIRRLEMKKAVMIEALVAMADARDALLDTPVDEMPQFKEVHTACAKLALLELVGDNNTIEPSIQLRADYMTTAYNLAVAAAPLVSCAGKIKTFQHQWNENHEKSKSLLARKAEKTAPIDILEYTSLGQRLDLTNARMVEITKSVEELCKQEVAIRDDYSNVMQKEFQSLRQMEHAVTRAMREELGFDTKSFEMHIGHREMIPTPPKPPNPAASPPRG